MAEKQAEQMAAAAAQGQMPGGAGQGQMTAEDMQRQQEETRQKEEQHATMLRAVLDSEARERLKRIAVVKPEKARAIENYVIQSVRQGRMAPPVNDSKLKQLLEAMNQEQGGANGPKITFVRKNRDDDDW
eukprot:Rhum_TRINITY_DN15564_c0_g1::Rhum_TRINITY_DN15564_c0_g1_i1::g.161235::m.161235/K06875/PDCD5, TFAR19; programmed cell death protein 5